MKVRDFIEKLNKNEQLPESEWDRNYEAWLKAADPEQEVSDVILDFVDNFPKTEKNITSRQVQYFIEALSVASPIIQTAVLYSFLLNMGDKVLWDVAADEVEALKQYVKDSICKVNYLPYPGPLEGERIYEKFLIFHFLQSIFGENLLEVTLYGGEASLAGWLQDQIPFTLNTLALLGRLPNIQLDFLSKKNPSEPFSALAWPVPYRARYKLEKDIIQPQVGIKDQNRLFMIDRADKIYKGGGNTTNLAVDPKKKKLMFVRNHRQKDRGHPCILASKIARRVSPKHFSSERLLTNGNVASRKLEGYAIPVCSIEDELRRYKYYVPGLGIIDEVSRFVNERDIRTENIGVSERNLQRAYFTKIDWDWSGFSQLSNHERLLAKENGVAVYFDKCTFRDLVYPRRGVSELYVLERLETRFKLALFTDELLESDLRKCSYTEDEKQWVLKSVGKSRDHVLSLLFGCDRAELCQLIATYKINLPFIYASVIDYFIEHDSKHFSSEQCNDIIRSISKQLERILSTLWENNERYLSEISEQMDELKKECINKLLDIKKLPNKKEFKPETPIEAKPLESSLPPTPSVKGLFAPVKNQRAAVSEQSEAEYKSKRCVIQ